MSGDFVGMMRAEIAGLEGDLEKNPKYVRLTSLRRALATYGFDGNTSQVVAPPKFENQAKDRALAVAFEMVSATSGPPIPTRDIHERLLSEDIVLSGKNPVGNLSAILSGDERFKANGRSGWTLASAETTSEAALEHPIEELMKSPGKELKATVTHNPDTRNKRTDSDYDPSELM